MHATGEGTKSGAIDFSTECTLAMLENLNETVNHPDMTEELAKVLSTATVDLTSRIEADLSVKPSRQARGDEKQT